MLAKRVEKVKQNTKMIQDILKLNDIVEMHGQLDILINSVLIMYESREDFEQNYPDPTDLYGKINLIVTRRG